MKKKTDKLNILYIIKCSILCLLFFSCCEINRFNDSDVNIPQQIEDGWDTASPQSVGIVENILEDLKQQIIDSVYGEVHSIVIVKDNKLVFEIYFQGHDFNYMAPNFQGNLIDFDINTPHDTHSATKSIISTLTGIAIEKGFINSILPSILYRII